MADTQIKRANRRTKPPMDRGWLYERTEHNPREKAFADEWEKENIPTPGLNHGFGLLQDLFIDGRPFDLDILGKRRLVHRITKAERFVTATVIQWLGSNCGMSFLEEALKKCGYRVDRIRERD